MNRVWVGHTSFPVLPASSHEGICSSSGPWEHHPALGPQIPLPQAGFLPLSVGSMPQQGSAVDWLASNKLGLTCFLQSFRKGLYLRNVFTGGNNGGSLPQKISTSQSLEFDYIAIACLRRNMVVDRTQMRLMKCKRSTSEEDDWYQNI